MTYVFLWALISRWRTFAVAEHLEFGVVLLSCGFGFVSLGLVLFGWGLVVLSDARVVTRLCFDPLAEWLLRLAGKEGGREALEAEAAVDSGNLAVA